MSTEPSVPDYKKILVNNLEELKKEFDWCINNTKKVTKDKIVEFKKGVRNLKIYSENKITNPHFIRDMDRLEILIKNLPNKISDIERKTIEMIFERIQNIINEIE